MNCNPTLTAEEFRDIHNALWELDCVTRQLESVLKPELYVKLAAAGSQIRQGLAGAYRQDDAAYQRRSNHYEAVAADLAIRNSQWSISEVDNLNEPHPFRGATKVVYKDHWGEGPVECQIRGQRWCDLWLAANECVRASTDQHHIFIEQFVQDKNDPTVLVLYTGS